MARLVIANISVETQEDRFSVLVDFKDTPFPSVLVTRIRGVETTYTIETNLDEMITGKEYEEVVKKVDGAAKSLLQIAELVYKQKREILRDNEIAEILAM